MHEPNALQDLDTVSARDASHPRPRPGNGPRRGAVRHPRPRQERKMLDSHGFTAVH